MTNTITPHILIVEDQAPLADMMPYMLKKCSPHCIITVRYTLADALKELQRQNFDLVITDVNLGKGDEGVALTNKVKNTCPDTAVLMMSGADLAGTMGHCKPDAYMDKPFTMETLKEKVDFCLRIAVCA